jgi:hypothetical protein
VSNLFAKCGVSDRLALALFTRNHPKRRCRCKAELSS